MIKKRLLLLLAGTAVCSAAPAPSPVPSATPSPAQNAVDKPLSESDLIKQIETLSPLKPAVTPRPALPGSTPSLFSNSSSRASDLLKTPADKIGTSTERISPGTPGTPSTPAPGDKKTKGPTEITALEATFDQRANIAVFIGSVVVKDPEFNVICDKLTAFLKHENKTGVGKGAKVTPKPVTPNPATAKGGAATPAPRGGGLDHAIAITTSERRVIITQDKLEADGTITHGIGKSDWATYDANTGDIVLYGSPDVTKGNDRCIATDPSTVMTLTRDGRMKAVGPHKTIIIDDTPKDPSATPSPNANKPDTTNGDASKTGLGARSPQQ